MKFSEAIEKLLEGEKIWRSGGRVFYKILSNQDFSMFAGNGIGWVLPRLSREDLEANDWEVVE
jgi:hypothetical protein